MIPHVSQYYHYPKDNAKQQGADEEIVMLFISATLSVLSKATINSLLSLLFK
jgi:hypothetical protein